MSDVISISRLTKLYRNGRGVKNINLTVEEGDIVGLLGPNGSGKTTIMKCILGLNRFSEGHIKVFGKDMQTHFEEIMRNVGALVEAPAIYKDLSAYKNLVLRAVSFGGVSKERIDLVLDMMHLLPYKKDKAGRFSLGMKQRLGLAAAFLTEPKLMILDEPVNGLDIEGVVEVREIIKRMNSEKGTSFLISSHMASEIEKTCNKVAVMCEGELIAFDTTENALRLNPTLEDYFLNTVKEKRGEIVI